MTKHQILFPGQNKNEHVKLMIKKHWITHIYVILKFIFIGIIPCAAVVVIASMMIEDPFEFGGVFSLVLFAAIFGLAFALQYSYIEWINDELDFIIVTDQRVIDITQVSFLNSNIAEAPLNQIQDVKGETKGILGTLMHFGNIRIATANNMSVSDMDTVPRPQEMARQILDAVHAETEQHQNITNKVQHSHKANLEILNEQQGMRDRMFAQMKNLFGKKVIIN